MTSTITATLSTWLAGDAYTARVTSAGLWVAVARGSSPAAAADAACALAGARRPEGAVDGAVEASSAVVEARASGGPILRALGIVGPRSTIVLPA
jgi:hypothetical protein